MKPLLAVCVLLGVVCVLHADADMGVLLYIPGRYSESESSVFHSTILEGFAFKSEGEPEDEGCRQDMEQYQEAMGSNELWAKEMLDASTLFPNLDLIKDRVQLGDYDECLKVMAPFPVHHCMVSTTNLGNLSAGYVNRWALCIPASCKPRDVEANMNRLLNSDGENVSRTRVGDHACQTRGQSTLSPGDYIVIILLGVLAAIVALSTYYDLANATSESRSTFLVSFSVPANLNKLLQTTADSDTLAALHGIRTLSMWTVVIGYTVYNVKLTPHLSRDPTGLSVMLMLYLWSLSVNTFFLVSGVLVCYGLLKKMEGGRRFYLPLFYLHRYIRLTPAFAMMILLTATLLGNMGDGPLWQETVLTEEQSCVDNWWAGIIYINNYYKPLDACVKQSWVLSANMHMYLLSPFIIYLLRKWPKIWQFLIGAFIIVGIVIGYPWYGLFDNEHGAMIRLRDEHAVATHPQVTPWVIGMGLGYVLHTTKASSPNMTCWKKVIGWILSIVFLAVSVAFVAAIMAVTNDFSYWLPRPFWSFGVSWIIYACVKGYGGPVNKLLSWKGFQVLGRLSFCVYLVHVAVASTLLGSIRTPIHVNSTTHVMYSISILVLSHLAALVLFLVCEAPALVVEKSFLIAAGFLEKNQSRNDIQDRNPSGPSYKLTSDTVDMPFIDEDTSLHVK